MIDELKAELRTYTERIDKLLDDHERRLREIEKYLYLGLGGGGLIVAIFEHLSHVGK